MPAVSTLGTATTTCNPVGMGNPWDITTSTIVWLIPTALCATSLSATAYRSQADAAAQTNPVSTVTVGLPTATLTLGGLQPNTDYWVRFSGGFGIQGPHHTDPVGGTTTTTTTTTTGSPKVCFASWRTVSAWPGGFLGEVTVVNTTTTASTSWQVGWTWSGTARLTASYHATLGGTAVSPTLTALDWNRVIQPGGSTKVQVQGTVSGPVLMPQIACTLT